MNLMLRRRAMMASGPKEQPNYLCFTALESGTITAIIGSGLNSTNYTRISYSVDAGDTWVSVNNITSSEVTLSTPTVNLGDKILWKGIGLKTQSSDNINNTLHFTSTCRFDVSGNPLSLINGTTASKSNSTSYLLGGLFWGCTTIISAEHMELSLETVGQYCYNKMFYNASNLLKAPSVCLAKNCGIYTFNGMFWNCGSMQTGMDISSVNGGKIYLFSRMYQNDQNLESDIIINFTNANNNGIVNYMLYGCKKVNYIKALFLEVNIGSSRWVENVANNGIFVKHIDATWTNTGVNGVPTNWTVIYYDPNDDKYYTDQQKTQECDDHGNPI